MAKKLDAREIAKHLMSDTDAYKEHIEVMVRRYLNEHESDRIYWDAWFRGAEGKDLEDANRGKEFEV